MLSRTGFDYGPMGPVAAGQLRGIAEQVRQGLKRRTLVDIVTRGNKLWLAKRTLPRGKFGPWLSAEFDWTERTAERSMAVAAWLGNQTDIMSDLDIGPTAAYILAAASVPEEARQEALARACTGERITTALCDYRLGLREARY